MYDKGDQGGADPLQLDVQRAANFIENVLEALCEVPFHRREGGRRHLEIEAPFRNAAVRRKRAENDGYRCQVCDFNFVEKYGELGEKFAEVHHIKRLADNEGFRITSTDDLRTVCANCHRMLHRMEGKGLKDLNKLRKFVQQA
jgi:5-methylcytosine-specific restriction protein A